MNFMQAIATCFGKYVTFSGRARRAEYWLFFLFQFLAGIGAAILDSALVAEGKPFTAVVFLVFFLPGLAVTVRRLHDVNRRGWWMLLPVSLILAAVIAVPIYKAGPPFAAVFAVVGGSLAVIGLGSGIVLLVWYCTAGSVGSNRFGPDPLRDVVSQSAIRHGLNQAG